MLHKVYITYGLKFRVPRPKYFILFILISVKLITAQQSLNSYGFLENKKNNLFRMNSIESNISNYSTTEDWEFSLTMNSILNNQMNINLRSLSLGKRFNDHYLYLRYTPGIKQEFIFNSATEVLINNSPQNLQSYLSYSEKYGMGYSYSFSNSFSFGISLRYFQQEFIEEYLTYFSSDTTNLIQIKNETANKDFWRGDIGFDYFLYDNLNLSLASVNLLIMKDFDVEDEFSEFEIKTNNFNLKQDKGVKLGIKYYPNENISLLGEVESNGSFIFGTNFNYSVDNNSLTIGSTLLHDKYQRPFISGILPSINYSTNLFSITLSYLKYFNDRGEIKSLDQFREFGLASIQNNFFSKDKISFALNFALSFKQNKQLKIIDVEIESEIFPSFKDYYLDTPIATGKIINLTENVVSIKPSTFIDNITSERIYSPLISVGAKDTAIVPFFILLDEESNDFEKTKIAQASFYVSSISEEPDDEIQKPLLIHSINSWDGNVRNLRYFVKSDLDFSNKYSTKIISTNKFGRNNSLKNFEIIQAVFNEFSKEMNYVSDRRATVDFVQFPEETIELKGGDCDDLSVCFSSLLESVGIQTAFIDYKPENGIGHVALLVNTNLTPNESELITINERKYFVRENYSGKNEVWLPIEVTSLENFEEAWSIGANKFYMEAIDKLGLSKNKIEIIDIY